MNETKKNILWNAIIFIIILGVYTLIQSFIFPGSEQLKQLERRVSDSINGVRNITTEIQSNFTVLKESVGSLETELRGIASDFESYQSRLGDITSGLLKVNTQIEQLSKFYSRIEDTSNSLSEYDKQLIELNKRFREFIPRLSKTSPSGTSN